MTEIKNIEGRLQMWVPTPAPGHWACAEPDDPENGGAFPDFCGHPVDDEPCPWHHPDPLIEAVARALFESPVWFTFGTNPLAKELGGPTEARRRAAREAVAVFRSSATRPNPSGGEVS